MKPILTVDHHYQQQDFRLLWEMGVRHFRINPARIGIIRACALHGLLKETLPGAICFIDTAGSKCRIGINEKQRLFEDSITLGLDDKADLQISAHFLGYICKGDVLLVGRAGCELLVEHVGAAVVHARVDRPVTLTNRMPLFYKHKYIENKSLSEEDREVLLTFPLADAVGLSFTDCEDMVKQANACTQGKVFAKIESPRAVAAADSILKQASGLIIARDDLSQFYNAFQLDQVMYWLIDLCNEHGKPAVPASNMFLDLLQGTQLHRTSSERIRRIQSKGVRQVYCNESVLKKDMHMIRKIFAICED